MIRISYHAWKDFESCPKKYFLKNRKKLPATVPRNDYFMLYGKLTEQFFTLFCNNWRYQSCYMSPDDIKKKLEVLFKQLMNRSVVNWTAPYATLTEEEIFNQSYTDICTIMDSHNQNYFLNSKSEITIEMSTKDGALVNGRLDFVHKDALTSSTLVFDGKGSSDIGKYVDDDQVLFYSLLHYFHFKILPDELGFFYYRFNTFKPVDISLSILNEFRSRLSLGIKKIMKETDFLATPTPKACKFCDYRNKCPEYLEDSAKRKRPSRLDIPDQEGIVDLSF